MILLILICWVIVNQYSSKHFLWGEKVLDYRTQDGLMSGIYWDNLCRDPVHGGKDTPSLTQNETGPAGGSIRTPPKPGLTSSALRTRWRTSSGRFVAINRCGKRRPRSRRFPPDSPLSFSTNRTEPNVTDPPGRGCPSHRGSASLKTLRFKRKCKTQAALGG